MTETQPLMQGERGLSMGVANDRSIAWGIAKTLAAHGAELAFTYQADVLERRVKPLAESLGSTLMLQCDVTDDDSLDKTFSELEERWNSLDFIVHAIAFSDKNELTGKYLNTSRSNFSLTILIWPVGTHLPTLFSLSGEYFFGIIVVGEVVSVAP